MAKVKGFLISDIFKQQVLNGTVNGVNDEFTLSSIPHSDGAVMIFLNGNLQMQGTDYTISTTTITFAVPPVIGQSVSGFYISKR